MISGGEQEQNHCDESYAQLKVIAPAASDAFWPTTIPFWAGTWTSIIVPCVLPPGTTASTVPDAAEALSKNVIACAAVVVVVTTIRHSRPGAALMTVMPAAICAA